VIHQASRDQSLRNLSEIQQSTVKLLMNLEIFAHVVTLRPWPLTYWLWTFTALRVWCV